MDDKRHDFSACFTLSNLMKSADDCFKGVRWKGQPQRFMVRKLTNCERLLSEIENGSYSPKHVKPFAIVERGKPRTVKPVAYRDRVAQRCFCDHVLTPAIKDYVSPECSAVLPERGLSYAFERVRTHAERCIEGAWFVQYDFSDYFHSIDRSLVFELVKVLVDDERLRRFAYSVLMAEQGGLDLGSHVSQLLAAAFASPVDFALESMQGVIGHHRYMDDGIIFAHSKEDALDAMEAVCAMAKRLRLVINPKKTNLNRIKQPFVFCKMRFTKQEDGSVRMNVRKAQSRRSTKHVKSVHRLSKTTPIEMQPVIASYRGYINRGDVNLSWLADKTIRQME